MYTLDDVFAFSFGGIIFETDMHAQVVAFCPHSVPLEGDVLAYYENAPTHPLTAYRRKVLINVSFLAFHGPGFPAELLEDGDKCIFSELGIEHKEAAKLVSVAFARGIIHEGYVTANTTHHM